MLSSFKRQTGFIKNSSSKKIVRMQEERKERGSDESFSSFQFGSKNKKDDFSPYRHDSQLQQEDRIKTKNYENIPNSSKTSLKPQSKFTNIVLQNNFIQEQNRIKQAHLIRNSQNIKSKQHNQNNYQPAHAKEQLYSKNSEQKAPKMNRSSDSGSESEEELSLSNINKFRTNTNKLTHGFQKEIEQKYPKQITRSKKYIQQSPSSSLQQSSQGETGKKTVKILSKRAIFERNKYNQGEQLIMQYDKKEFKDKSLKTAILHYNNIRLKQPSQDGTIQAPGGLCYEFDKRQFKQQTKKVEKPKKHKKKEINSKEEIIKRRLNAKIYDRLTRTNIFGY